MSESLPESFPGLCNVRKQALVDAGGGGDESDDAALAKKLSKLGRKKVARDTKAFLSAGAGGETAAASEETAGRPKSPPLETRALTALSSMHTSDVNFPAGGPTIPPEMEEWYLLR
jgi:hypothetical protein